MAKILISYRRSYADHAGRLYDTLTNHYGADQVRINYAYSEAGTDFRQHMLEAIESCETLIVIIGPHWRGLKHGKKFAIENDYDPIRQEVATALRLRKIVIPILVGGASMPSPAHLPDDIRNLSYQNCLKLRELSFPDDVKRLVKSIDDAQDLMKRHLTLLKSRGKLPEDCRTMGTDGFTAPCIASMKLARVGCRRPTNPVG